MPTPKEEVEELMRSLLPVAERMLKEAGEFYPYGGYTESDGKITHVSGRIEGTDHPKSKPIIDMLIEKFKQMARSGTIKAAAVIFDVRIKLPGAENKTDAIQVCLDHRGGYSVEVLFPYIVSKGELQFGKAFAQEGDDEIFEPI
jgi:hypothetical protein